MVMSKWSNMRGHGIRFNKKIEQNTIELYYATKGDQHLMHWIIQKDEEHIS